MAAGNRPFHFHLGRCKPRGTAERADLDLLSRTPPGAAPRPVAGGPPPSGPSWTPPASPITGRPNRPTEPRRYLGRRSHVSGVCTPSSWAPPKSAMPGRLSPNLRRRGLHRLTTTAERRNADLRPKGPRGAPPAGRQEGGGRSRAPRTDTDTHRHTGARGRWAGRGREGSSAVRPGGSAARARPGKVSFRCARGIGEGSGSTPHPRKGSPEHLRRTRVDGKQISFKHK